jgi:hypothetical protein
MEVNLPPQVRLIIYVVVTLGTAAMVPLHIGGVVSDLVFNVWTSLAGAATLLAALNVNRNSDPNLG